MLEMTELARLLPAGSIATPLIVIIIWLLRSNHQDRAQYREHLKQAEERDEADRKEMAHRHAEELAAAERRHSAQMEYVQNEMATLRKRIDDVLQELDEERRKRWAAEEEAAVLRTQLAGGGPGAGRHSGRA